MSAAGTGGLVTRAAGWRDTLRRGGVDRGDGEARAKNPPQVDRDEAGVGLGKSRNLTVSALDRQPVGTWQCLARRRQRKLLTRSLPAAGAAPPWLKMRQGQRPNPGARAIFMVGTKNHGGPRRTRGSRSAGLTGRRMSQLPQQVHGLRGPPWFSFCLRVKSFIEFRAGTGAACLPVCLCRRESERRGRPRSGPVRELCLDACAELRVGRWPPPGPARIVLATDRTVRLSPRR
jgi:hypothetical protein